MATTKQLLETTILKVASNAIGRNPTTGIEITVDQTSTNWQYYTAPRDGFIRFFVTGGTETNAMHLKDQSANPAIESLIRGWTTQCAFTPRVWKGRTAYFRVKEAHTGLTAVFFESIGGGYSLLKAVLRRGGAVWLRLKNCLTQPSKRVASSLSLIRMPQPSRSMSLQELTQGQRKQNTLHHRTASLRCEGDKYQEREVPNSLFMALLRHDLTARVSRLITAIRQFGCQYEKASSTLCSHVLTQVQRTFTPTTHSLCIEGVSYGYN